MNSRIRVPAGYVRLRQDLGQVIQRRRKDERMPQKVLAADIGITRESLSRIESGRGGPSYDTLYKIMGLLDLDWHEIAIAGQGSRPSRRFPKKSRDENREELGSALRAGRKAEGLSLRELANSCDVSYSQLSRIERGESDYSRVLEEYSRDEGLGRDYHHFRFGNSKLAELAGKGRDLIRKRISAADPERASPL